MGRRLKRTEEERKKIREENEKRRERMWKNIQEEVEKLRKEMFKDPLFDHITEKFGKTVKSSGKEKDKEVSGQPDDFENGVLSKPKEDVLSTLKEDENGVLSTPKEGVNGPSNVLEKEYSGPSNVLKEEIKGSAIEPLRTRGEVLNNQILLEMIEYIISTDFHDKTKLFLIHLLVKYKNTVIKITKNFVQKMGYSKTTYFVYVKNDVKKNKFIKIKPIKQGRNGFTVVDFTSLKEIFEERMANLTKGSENELNR